MPRASQSRRLLGLISDTHGLLRVEAVRALDGVDLIVHAGDIGKPEVLTGLKKIAPVVAIRGNNDSGDWAQRLPDTRTIEAGRLRIYLIHNIRELTFDPAGRRIGAVISGHSHKPSITENGGVLFINPGSPGPRRFKLPVTVGKLWIDGARPRAEIIELSV
jgi:putative phosphoesterase